MSTLRKLSLFFLARPLAAQQETRRRIESTLFVPDPSPALNPVSYGNFEPTPGVVAERITYGTSPHSVIP